MTAQKLVGQQIQHAKYGTGTVEGLDGGKMSVRFETMGVKTFMYPDAFERFLETRSDSLKQIITEDLQKRRTEADYIARAKNEAGYEKAKAFEKRKKEERERRIQAQIEKVRNQQRMREQRIQNRGAE